MSYTASLVLRISVVGLILCVGYSDILRSRSRRYLLTVLLLGAGVVIFALTPPDDIETKGNPQEVVGIVLGFITTILGMVAEYFYRQVEQGKKKFKFNLVSFAGPILASPIVFLPLFSMFAETDFTGPFTRAKFMLYLVAFQNGFFWRNFFEERRKRVIETLAAPAPNSRTARRTSGSGHVPA